MDDEKYRSLLEQSIDGFVLINGQGIITEWNKGEEEITGLKRDEVLGRPIWEVNYTLFPDETRAEMSPIQLRSSILTILHKRKSSLLNKIREYKIKRPDGAIRTIQLVLFMVPSKDDFSVGSITRDVTRARQAEEDLKLREARYRNIVETAREGIWIIGLDGKTVFANRRMADILGYTREEMNGRVGLDIIEMGDQNLFRAAEFKDASGIQHEYKLRRKDGGVVWTYVNASPVFGSQGKYTGNLMMHTDITEIKKAEDHLIHAKENLEIRVQERTFELQKANEFSTSLLDNSPTAVVVMNPDGSIRYMNPQVEVLTGYSQDEAIGSRVPYPWWPPEKRARYKKIIQSALGGKKRISEVIFRHKSGDKIWVKVTLVPILAGDELKYILGNWVNITEEKRLREELEKYARKVTQVQEEERKRIAYELHDDTAQSLAILKLQLDSIIHSGKVGAPEITGKLEHLEKDTDRALQDIRRYSHELRPSVLDFLGLVAALEQLAEDIMNLDSLRVEVSVAGEERKLSDEASLALFRIAQEALNNARKHAQATLARIDIEFQKNSVKLIITDDGQGFNVRQEKARPGGGAAWGY